jgi:hypothetical protein
MVILRIMPHGRQVSNSDWSRQLFRLKLTVKYPEKFARKYLQKCPQKCCRLRRHVCLLLNLNLDLDLDLNSDLDLNPSLYRAFFTKSYESLLQQLLASLFGLMFALMFRQLQASSYPKLGRRMLPPRQPVGRPLPGRIVVRDRPTTTYRWAETGHGPTRDDSL